MNNYLLPDLTHTEVTIFDRLANINRLLRMRSDQQNSISGRVETEIYTSLYVERLRAMTMNIKVGITTTQNVDIKKLNRWGYTQRIQYSTFHKNLIDCYCFFGDYYDIHDQLNEIIIYYNSIVSYATPHYINVIIPIDTEYLSRYFKGNLYNEYKRSIGNIFKLMDALDPHRIVIDVYRHINFTTLVDGLTSNISIDHRMVYIDHLKELIPVCSLEDFSFLMASIFVEETRVFCMSFFIKENMVRYPNHIDFPTLTYFMKRHMGNKLHQMCYVVEYLSVVKLTHKLYDHVFDMILYHNTMNQRRTEPNKDLDTTLLDDLTKECLLIEQDSIITFLRGKFRQHVISEIIA